jgi:hypothetical protein
MNSLKNACAALALTAMVFGVCEAQNSPPGSGAGPTVREACAADAARLCGDAKDPGSRKQCMNEHRNELSEGCIKARKAAHAVNQAVPQGDGNGASKAPAPSAASGTAAVADGGLDWIRGRIVGHGFPSVFAPWNLAENLQQNANTPAAPLSATETETATAARHDLYFAEWQKLGLKLANNQKYAVLTPEFTPESIQTALRNRAALLAANPNILILVSVHYNAATPRFLPSDSPYWRHDDVKSRFNANNREYGSHRLDFSNPAFQNKVAALCAALVKTEVYDGCMFDGWHDDEDSEGRLALIQKTRAAIGEKALIVGNVNQRLPTRTAPYLNGMYLEGFGGPSFFPDWHMAAANLLWGESHLRKPAITALEGWYLCSSKDCPGDPAQIQERGRTDYARMRLVTTLSLVFSNGYVLFSDPNPLPTPDHLHDWYSFWDKSLGRPVGSLADLKRPDLSGAYTRLFEKGEVVFNPPGNRPVTVRFDQPRRSTATGVTGRSFTLAPGDGDLFLNEH